MTQAENNCACCKARYIKFRLAGALDTSTAKQSATVVEFWDGSDPAPNDEEIFVYNLCESDDDERYCYTADEGAVGYAVLDEQNEPPGGSQSSDECFYRIITMCQDLVRFELKEDLVVCGSAPAVIVEAPESCEEIKDIEVVDTIGIARLEREGTNWIAPAGSMGFARFLRTEMKESQFEVVSIGLGCCEPKSSSSSSCSSSDSSCSSSSSSSCSSSSCSSSSSCDCVQIPGVDLNCLPFVEYFETAGALAVKGGCLVLIPACPCYDFSDSRSLEPSESVIE